MFDTPPRVEISAQDDGTPICLISGTWTLASVADKATEMTGQLIQVRGKPDVSWNAENIDALDSAGGMLLWRVWGRKLPERARLNPRHEKVFERIAAADKLPVKTAEAPLPFAFIRVIGASTLQLLAAVREFVTLLGDILLNLIHLVRHTTDLPAREISATLYKAGVRAMPVTALVGFLIGVALSYLTSFQLRQYGADVFIINILGLSVVRELGPVLVAVLVAGRSGSAMTAQLGTMRVTEEIDALATMGVLRSLRLVFPKVLALSIAMPMLVLWTTAAALVGGMVSAEIQLDLSYGFFIETLPKVVPVANVWIGLAKGWVFGITIALVACHYGLRVRPNTESLSANTTASVVVSIALVILIDAVFAIATRGMGMP